MTRIKQLTFVMGVLACAAPVRAEYETSSFERFDDVFGFVRVFTLETDVDADLDRTEVVVVQDGNELDFVITEIRNGEVVDEDDFDIFLSQYDEIWVLGGPNVNHFEALGPVNGPPVTLAGGPGNDYLAGPVRLGGSDGDDRLVDGISMEGGQGNDTVIAGPLTTGLGSYAGNNLIDAGNANGVRINGGGGDDLILGSPGNDQIYGKHGDDVILAGGGNDEVDGGPGADALYGGSGNDVLDAGPLESFGYYFTIRESVYGNSGRDTFEQKDVNNHYTDYNSSQDVIYQPFTWWSRGWSTSTYSLGF